MSLSRVQKITKLLGAIPHNADCGDGCSKPGCVHEDRDHACNCGRDMKIAILVMEIVARGMWCAASHGHGFNWDAALQAHATTEVGGGPAQ